MLKVLIAEDEEMIRKGIVLTVNWTALDCVVVAEAANGEEALAAARRYRPALIITDIKMPKMDGLELVRALRAEGNNAFVIFLTAYDDFSYVQSALRLGAVDYLLKPFHDGELERAVSAVHRSLGEAGEETLVTIPGIGKGDKSKYVQFAMSYIESHYSEPDISVGAIAANLGISEGHLSHTFKKETDYTLLSYLTRCRVQKAMTLLQDCRIKIYEVAERVGYRDIAYFSTTFKKLTGMTPSEYQGTCR